MLERGARVGGCVVDGPLGAGGMGSVFRGRDLELKRPVAIKVLQESALPPEELGEARARFTREARALAAVSHPNVVAVYQVASVGDTPAIVMELVEGMTLRDAMRCSPGLHERVRWLRDVALALASAHAVDVVHRDLKPDNVVLREDGVVKLIDFGLAKRVTPRTDVTFETLDDVVLGTPRYMAPEQRVGSRADARSDQFAWGRMAFELLAKQLPPHDATPLPPLPQAMPGVPTSLVQAIAQTQEPIPAKRLRDMREAADACELALAALAERDAARTESMPPPPTPEATTPRRTPRPEVLAARGARSSTAIFAAAALGVVAVGVAGAVIASRAWGARSPAAPASSLEALARPASSAPAPTDAAVASVVASDDGDAAPTEALAPPDTSASSSARSTPPALPASDHVASGPACSCRSVRGPGVLGPPLCLTAEPPSCECVDASRSPLCLLPFDGAVCHTDRTMPGRRSGEACRGIERGEGAEVSGTLRCSLCQRAFEHRRRGVQDGAACRGFKVGWDTMDDGLWDCRPLR